MIIKVNPSFDGINILPTTLLYDLVRIGTDFRVKIAEKKNDHIVLTINKRYNMIQDNILSSQMENLRSVNQYISI